MKRVIVLFLSLFICGQSFCCDQTTNDSTTIKTPSEKIDKLNTDFVLLKAENETLQKANDRIITSVYFCVGLILASALGLGIFNLYQGNKLNTLKMENLVQASKNEIDSAMDVKILKAVNNKELNEASRLERLITIANSKTEGVNNQLLELREQFLINQLPKHPFYKVRSEEDRIMELIELQLSSRIYGLDITLQGLVQYLKGNGYMTYDQKNRITEIIDKDLKDKFPHLLSEIRELIKTRVD